MKKKHVMIGTILTMLLLLCGAGTAFASTYEGHLDGVSGNTISGWAWDSADPESAVNVQVVIKKQGTAEIVQDSTVSASQYREELQTIGKGTGKYGFNVTVDWTKLDTGFYTVEAWVADEVYTNTLTYQNGQAAAVLGSGNLIPLGVFKTTAYCPCLSCSEGWGNLTSTGARAVANHTIAVDPRVIPYGSKVMINGIIYTAEDKGGAVKGNHIDIYFNTHGETRVHGTRNEEVFLVQ